MKTLTNLMVLFFTAMLTDSKPACGQDAPQYYLVDLGTLGGVSTYATGINNNGKVCGWSNTSSGLERAFLWSDGSMMDLGTLGGSYSAAYGINDNDHVVGYSSSVSGDRAFLWSDGSMMNLGTLGGSFSLANGINNASQVVGYSSTNGYYRAFLWSDGSMSDLGTLGGDSSSASAINNVGQVVGNSSTSNEATHAFLWSNGSMSDLRTLGGNYSSASAINNVGKVVGISGSYTNNGTTGHPFLWSEGSMTDLDILEGGYSVAEGINDIGQVVGSPFGNTFLYFGNEMFDLNSLLINPDSEWELEFAKGINNSGQIVANGLNSLGQYHAFRLDPLPNGWRETIETAQPQPTYGDCPDKEPGKDSLIVVTHGVIPTWRTTPEEATAWVDNMTNTIQKYLDGHELNNWQVVAHKWIDDAKSPSVDDILLDYVLDRAERNGAALGKCIVLKKWSRIHFIAHSAGSALIQSATETIKSIVPDVIIQETFLDPYVGTGYHGRNKYGYKADWADNYFCFDADTFNTGLFTYTSGPLDNAYNVDVTFLDTHTEVVKGFVSPGEGLTGVISAECERTKSSHDWPIFFYSNTVVKATAPEYKGFGFPLSKEGGGWDSALANYGTPNDPAQKLGTEIETCIPDTVPPAPNFGPQKDLSKFTVTGNPTDGFFINGFQFSMMPHSPVWVAFFVNITNPVNIVSFESSFSGIASSEELLAVAWDNEIIGLVDERVARPGRQRYEFAFPTVYANSTHILGFRVDSYTNMSSIVNITNVATGFVELPEKFSLSFASFLTNSQPIFELNGPAGYTYRLETSTNLVDWIDAAILANTNGVVQFIEPEQDNSLRKYFRAVIP